MTISAANAAAAYVNGATRGVDSGLEPRSADPGKSFAEMLGEAASSAIDTGRQAELTSVKAIAGKADLNEVVAAVSNAELTLQTAVAIRDRVIQAYQDIIRMPM